MQSCRVTRTVLPLLTVLLSAPAAAQWYVGLGSGSANLDTDTTPETVVLDSDAPTRANDVLPWKVVVGRSLEPFAFEAFHVNFGELELGPDGQLERRVSGLMGRKQLFGSDCMHGVAMSASAALGVGHISSGYRGVEGDASASSALVGGLSTSVHLGAGLSIRAQYDHFDRDTKLTSLSLVKGFGEGSYCQRRSTDHGSSGGLTAVAATAGSSDPVASAAEPTAPGGQFGNVQFNRDSSFLTERAESQLANLAALLEGYPGLVLEVQGHSDAAEWGGSDFGLSAERARRVASALAQRGVARERLKLSGYADSRPVASNGETALNQRVQFRILALR